MSEMKTVRGVLDIIKRITLNRESGRLDIDASGTRGTLLFNEGKLVHATLGTLNGFQAVNAVASLRDVQFSFDHVTPVEHSSSISPSERLVLKRFFGIEVAEAEEVAEEEVWNATPEPVVPLAEVARTSVLTGPRVALFAMLLLVLAVGAIALRSRFKAPQQTASVSPAVVESASPLVEPMPIATAPEPETPNLNGEWRVINTVEKTGYKSFDNMKVGFRLTINQKGNQFTAQGEKFLENGETLAAKSRTPIHLTGSIDGDRVLATFVEDGKMRRTNGRFVWKLEKGGDGLTGTFVTSAANSSGRSAVTKQ